MTGLPTGTVTFLLTDIEGSSKLWEASPDAMTSAIRRHHEIIHGEIERHRGMRPADQGEGDSVLAAFSSPTDAVTCALETQLRLTKEPWPEGINLRVRMAVNTGEAKLRDAQNYAGPSLNRSARLRSLAHGGQVLVSQSTWDLVRERPPSGSSFKDLGSHLLKDLAHPERVFQIVHPDLSDDFPPLRSLDHLPTNLPSQLTSMIGRERETGEVETLLSEHRLVTITGAAGCGKTRLAVHSASHLTDDFPEGVWFIDLAPVTDPELVSQTAATAMGLRVDPASGIDPGSAATGAADPVKKLTEAIRSRPILLVLDNCEHLVSASASLAEHLLRACSELHFLATSREPLGVPGEATYRVPSLGTPEPTGSLTLEEIAEHDAVRLFVDRASEATGGFTLTEDNAGAVGQIVDRLGGIPLAIELAAARVKALSPGQIADRLDDQFRLLAGGHRTALERQQTIRAAVDWSHDLLGEPEQILLRRLSAFVGGFGFDAAEGICAGDGLEASDVLDLLSGLVDKSLVIKEEKGAEARYRMLETIRQYGREKLVDSKEASRFRISHRDHFLALVEKAAPMLESPEVGKWLDVLEADLDNIRAAIEWSLSEKQGAEAAQRLAASLHQFWVLRGGSLEGHRWLESAVAKPGDVSPSVRAEALTALAGFEFYARADLTASRRRAEEGLRLAEAEGLPKVMARARVILGSTASLEGDLSASQSFFEEALSVRHDGGDPPSEGQSLLGLIQIAFSRGNVQQARRLSDEAVRFAQGLGRPVGIGRTLFMAARLEEETGGFSEAKVHYEQALAAAREVGDKPMVARTLGKLTRLVEADGRSEQAASYWNEACRIAREAGEAYWIFLLSEDALHRHDYREARSLAEEVLTIAREIGEPFPIASSLNSAGWSCYLQGDLQAALPYLEECERIVRQGAAGSQLLAAVLHSLGEARRLAGQSAQALLEESLAIGHEMGLSQVISGSLWSLGELSRAESDMERAADLHREALALARDGRKGSVLQSLEAVAGLVARTNGEAAARLFGAAEVLRDRYLEPRPPVLQKGYEADLAKTREALGEEAFEEARTAGKSMSLDEAVNAGLRVVPATSEP
jgi:predicted ATPase/class 3 adenylate cyclase